MKLHARLKPVTLAATFLTLSLFNSVVTAEELGAHEHGAARMTIATNDKGFEISLETPSANVFGFEYMASSDEDHHTIHEAVEVLEAGNSLFLANESAACTQESVDIESAQVEAHDKAKHGDHDEHDHDEKHEKEGHAEKDEHKDHDKHDHDEHDHDEEKHAEKDGHEDHDHEEGSVHSDVDVTWNFTCKNVSEIAQVEVKLFSAFPKGFQDLDIDWVSADKAGHAELDKDGVVSLK